MTPRSIIEGAIKLIQDIGWRKTLYTTKDEGDKTVYHIHEIGCFICPAKNPIIGITVSNALLRSFNSQQIPFAKSNMTCAEHEQPFYEAKCLLARIDPTIIVKQVDPKNGFLYPLYINLQEWNDRKSQTEQHIIDMLGLALIGDVPPNNSTSHTTLNCALHGACCD